MRQRLLAGEEIEFLTPAELETTLKAHQLREAEKEIVRTGEQVATDATGAALLDQIYAVPPGQELEVRRILIESDGSSPGVPFNAAAGWIDITVDGKRVDFVALAVGQGGIPFVFRYSAEQGPVLRNGQKLGARIAGGPANVNVEFSIQGIKKGPPAEG